MSESDGDGVCEIGGAAASQCAELHGFARGGVAGIIYAMQDKKK